MVDQDDFATHRKRRAALCLRRSVQQRYCHYGAARTISNVGGSTDFRMTYAARILTLCDDYCGHAKWTAVVIHAQCLGTLRTELVHRFWESAKGLYTALKLETLCLSFVWFKPVILHEHDPVVHTIKKHRRRRRR